MIDLNDPAPLMSVDHGGAILPDRLQEVRDLELVEMLHHIDPGSERTVLILPSRQLLLLPGDRPQVIERGVDVLS